MIELLARVFIKDRENTADPRVRGAYGSLCTVSAIVLNFILAAAKFAVGALAGSVSIAADAVNNLSDAGSSVLLLLGFRFAGKAPHPEHPFGHGRIEYVTGLAVAGIILFAGVEAARTAVVRIRQPEALEFSWAAVIVLVLSILVKLYMAFFHKKTGRRIASAALVMAGSDALNDTISTLLALLCLLLYRFTGLDLDAWCGLAVAALLLRTGFLGARDTLSQLLGQKGDPERVKQVEKVIAEFPEITGIHDLVIHDYGPGRFHVSLHAEVDGTGDIYALHDAMDRAMMAIDHRLGCQSVIHMDPVDTRDEHTAALRLAAQEAVARVDDSLSMHDFRVVPGPTHTNLIFDVVAPFRFRLTDEALRKAVRDELSAGHPECYCVIQVDRAYT